MKAVKLNIEPTNRTLVIRYPMIPKTTEGGISIDSSAQEKAMALVMYRPHQVLAVNEQTSKELGILPGDFVFVKPIALSREGAGISTPLRLNDVECFAVEAVFIIGKAKYAEPFEQDDDKRFAQVEEEKKNVLAPRARAGDN